MKNMYEIFDEYELANTKEERVEVLRRNSSQALYGVLLMTFHSQYEWLVNELPKNYKVPDVLPGSAFSSISQELRKFYMFRKGDPTAEKLTQQRRDEILLQILESLEFREAEVVIGIFKKDLGVKGLDRKLVKEVFPHMLS
jgi:hypothetical protein